ncbi:hypothetical protein G3545_13940 [Starkeya sp. ORNL1]|uniref:hypothetical protein n=1 Tax=Starkeya sp. ORNL1 TaxID=2709380 RepID=UPI0014641DE2|nr:hypothetical protein [Starkeya sp. ORNL1]QJP14644.1 hypothetical protein G3545_13940 [Starkeya sp. ORNL1]
MQHLKTLAGNGWLRTRDAGSVQGRYQIVISRRMTGPERGQLATRGSLTSEPWALVVARVDGSAVLILETGEALDIRLTGLALTDGDANFVVAGKMPAL